MGRIEVKIKEREQDVALVIETESERLRREGRAEGKKLAALRMLKKGKLIIEEIAEYSELSTAEVERLAGIRSL